ncbi:MAG: hypothetical protein ACO3MZ_02190 [Flavobacteriaceae bacterium]
MFYDSLAADYFDTHRVNMMMGELNMFYLTLGSLIQAYVLSVLYGRWCDCDRSIRSGFCFGAWIGAFVGFGMGLMMNGTMELMDLEATLVDAVWSVFYYGITGASIGWAYNLADGKKKAA